MRRFLNTCNHLFFGSFGGLLASLYASAHPDKVQKLILVTPAPLNSMYFEKTFNNRERKRNEEDTKKLVKLMSSKAFVEGDTSVFKQAMILADKINVVDTNKIREIFSHLKFTPQKATNIFFQVSARFSASLRPLLDCRPL